ncbi:hypothetical protein AZI86_07660 [Bdellovibrio bacteriovorus]|uniref:Fimbrial protein n=1 Tax=Bdellovibrio bacteriovorus TaxID=959 RepID=A0A150WR86_BDEBC|nr:hypothetical protein [Bdellovibrio bacteriovorus]KYG66898.1 hypothetical protein AZI86_07660 [Bdellovibrio bacteriovorus]
MKISKKTALALLSTLAVSTSALAATTGTLLLQGEVQQVLDLVVTAQPAATTLNITAGQASTKVATATETSNILTGYKIKISSTTNGELRHTVQPANHKTTYKVSYDGGAEVTPTVAGVEVKNVNALSGLTTDTSDINVSVVALSNAPAGIYQDTLTVTIEAN